MTRLAAAVIELPYGCEDCKFNAYHSNGTRYCLMHYTASIRDDMRPPRCQLVPWEPAPPTSGTDWAERIGQRLKALRSVRGLSLDTVAEAAGYYTSTLSRLEQGDGGSLMQLLDFCDFYGVSPGELFRDLGPGKEG